MIEMGYYGERFPLDNRDWRIVRMRMEDDLSVLTLDIERMDGGERRLVTFVNPIVSYARSMVRQAAPEPVPFSPAKDHSSSAPAPAEDTGPSEPRPLRKIIIK